jgi:hypothetical protein
MDYECDSGYVRTDDGKCSISDDEQETMAAKIDKD